MSEPVKYPPMIIIGLVAFVIFLFFLLFFLQAGIFCTICKITGKGLVNILGMGGITTTLTEIGVTKFCEVSTGGCRF